MRCYMTFVGCADGASRRGAHMVRDGAVLPISNGLSLLRWASADARRFWMIARLGWCYAMWWHAYDVFI